MMLPDGQGIDLLRGLRKRDNRTPVIIITALDQISDRIAGLNAGADDYLVKPFDLSELSARVSAVARRYGGNPNPLIVLGDLQINLVEHSLLRAGKAINLTTREWKLFEALLQRSGVVLSKKSTGGNSVRIWCRDRKQYDRGTYQPAAKKKLAAIIFLQSVALAIGINQAEIS